VRAIASRKLQRLAARIGVATGSELDIAHALMIAADIKRFLDRPAETARMQATTSAPPGAPIGGDVPQNWLAAPTWCVWQDEQ
jgi:hypothetical protein